MKNGEKPIVPIADMNNQLSDLIGLTKREYFAGLIVQGFCNSENYNIDIEKLVKKSIQISDELLKQLEK
jgi:hypothetical protein